MFDLLTRVHI